MSNNAEPGLSADEIRDLSDIAGTMIPESPAHGVPGADDPAILADIVEVRGPRSSPWSARPWRRSRQSRAAPSPASTATEGKP